MPTITTPDGVRLHYSYIGRGPVVIIPAAAYLHLDLTPLADNLTLLFYDQRSRGASQTITDPAKVSLEHEIADIEAIRRYFDYQKVGLLGWSYMGAVAALYAAKYPYRVGRLVMVGAIPPTIDLHRQRAPREHDAAGVAHLERLRAEGLPERDPAAFCREERRVYRPAQMGNPAAVDSIKSDPCLHANEQGDQAGKHMQALYATFGEWDWREEGAKVKAPTLIVHGEADALPMAGAEAWAAAIPNAELMRVPNAGHFPFVEAPEAFFGRVYPFLYEHYQEWWMVCGGH